ncbi:MAG TPA: UDP-N-acetylglucosamine 2-epimerase (non-hydrolyzing) [Candidatus Limnocylindrales bacterium]|nr:UDP-N-acetylglucosamine 2-epimerase (non-hydrolyzing) [Candidatus Limnocylindrales bacterium]
MAERTLRTDRGNYWEEMTAANDSRKPRAIRIVPRQDGRSGWNGTDRRWQRTTVLIVVGTRPEVIKLAPVVRALEQDATMDVKLCVVAQQTDILDQALEEWALVPDDRIELPQADRRLAAMLGAMLPRLADVIERTRPGMVVVEGDTTTNLAASLAAFYAGVPVAHVEAGLRSGDLSQPFPEEMHRVLVDQLAAVHYAPTLGARQNLLDGDHRNPADVVVVGNTVVDALLATLREAAATPEPEPERQHQRQMMLVTAHRRENFGSGIAAICEAIRRLLAQREDLEVIFVLHTNPRAFRPVRQMLDGLDRVELVPPQPYRAFVRLLARADIVLTDSGGVQEEAPYLGKPVLVTRELTERPEASQAGAASIIGTDTQAIIEAVNSVLDDPILRSTMSRRIAPYGDGHAAARIQRDLSQRLQPRERAARPADSAEIAEFEEAPERAPLTVFGSQRAS